jgi:hypothetical protein
MTFKVGIDSYTGNLEVAVLNVSQLIQLSFDSAPIAVSLTNGSTSLPFTIIGNTVRIAAGTLTSASAVYTLTVDAIKVIIYSVATVRFNITGLDVGADDIISANFTNMGAGHIIDDFSETDILGSSATKFFVRNNNDELDLMFEEGAGRSVTATRNGVSIASPEHYVFTVGQATVYNITFSA